MKKHNKITHENLIIYCHYFNNDKICPFKEECLFLHEEAETCKFGKLCERMFCMYKHESENDNDIVGENIVSDNVNNLGIIDEESVPEDEISKIVDVDDMDDTENANDVPNTTFINPS